MSRAKSFNDFSYGVGLEYNASSYKQVKDTLKGDLDSLKKLAKAYEEAIKVDPNVDLSKLVKEFKDVKDFIDQMKKSGNPFSEFVDKGVLDRVAALERGMQGLTDNSAELKNMLGKTFGEIKNIGSDKFSGTFDKIFADKSREIKATTEAIKALSNELDKLENLNYDPSQKFASSNVDIKKASVKELEQWIDEYKKLEKEYASIDSDNLEAVSASLEKMRIIGTQINEALRLPNIKGSKNLAEYQKFRDGALSAFSEDIASLTDSIEQETNDLSKQRAVLETELEKLQAVQEKYNVQNQAKAKNKNAVNVGTLDQVVDVAVKPKVDATEWAKLINGKIASVQDKLDPVVLKATFAKSSKNLEKDLEGNLANINHKVNVEFKVEENLGDENDSTGFYGKIKKIDDALKEAKAKIEGKTQFKIKFAFEGANGEGVTNVKSYVQNQFKNIPVTLHINNGKSFMKSIDNLKSGIEEKVVKKLKDIPISLKVGNEETLMTDIDRIRANIDGKLQGVEVGLVANEFIDINDDALQAASGVNELTKSVERLNQSAKKKQSQSVETMLKEYSDLAEKTKKENVRKNYTLDDTGWAKYEKDIQKLEKLKIQLGPALEEYTKSKELEKMAEGAAHARENITKANAALEDLEKNKFNAKKFFDLGYIKNDIPQGFSESLKKKVDEWNSLNEKITKENADPGSQYSKGKYDQSKYRKDEERLIFLEKDLNEILKNQINYLTQKKIINKEIASTRSKVLENQDLEKGSKESLVGGAIDARTEYDKLNKTIGETEEILSKLNSGNRKGYLQNTDQTWQAIQLGEWDKNTKKFKRNKDEMKVLINQYRELHKANKAANITDKNDPKLKEEYALRQKISNIIKDQKKHISASLVEQKKQKDAVMQTMAAYQKAPTNSSLVNDKNVVQVQPEIAKGAVAKEVKKNEIETPATVTLTPEDKDRSKKLAEQIKSQQNVIADLNKNKRSSKYFTQLGGWDSKAGAFKKNTAEVEKMLARYKELAAMTKRTEAQNKEKNKLNGQLTQILLAQKKHTQEIVDKNKEDLRVLQNKKTVSEKTAEKVAPTAKKAVNKGTITTSTTDKNIVVSTPDVKENAQIKRLVDLTNKILSELKSPNESKSKKEAQVVSNSHIIESKQGTKKESSSKIGTEIRDQMIAARNAAMEKLSAQLRAADMKLDKQQEKMFDELIEDLFAQDENGNPAKLLKSSDMKLWDLKFQTLKTNTGTDKIEKDVETQILKLYEKLGGLITERNSLNKEESYERVGIQDKINLIVQEIQEKQKLAIIDKELIKSAIQKGNAEKAAAINTSDGRKADLKANKEEIESVNELITLYKQLGQIDEKMSSLGDGYEKIAFADEKQKIQSKIDAKQSPIKDEYIEAYIEAREKERIQLNKQLGRKEDISSVKENITAVRDLAKAYETLGIMQANLDRTRGQGARNVLEEQIQKQKALILEKENGINVDEKLFDEKRVTAYNKQIDKLTLAEAKRADKAEEADRKSAFSNVYGLAEVDSAKSKKDQITGKTLSNDFKDSQVIEDALNKLNLAYDRLINKQQQFSDANPAQDEVNEFKMLEDQYNEALTKLDAIISASRQLAQNKVWDKSVTSDDISNVDKLKTTLMNAVNVSVEGKVKFGAFREGLKELDYSVQNADGSWSNFTAAVNKAENKIIGFNKNAKQTKSFLGSMFSGTAEKFKSAMMVFSGYDLFYKAIEEIRKGIQHVKEIDLALTELKKVTSETDATYAKFLQTASKTSAVIGSTVSDFTNATADFARLGYSITEASKLAEAASIYKNVGDGIENIDDASASIISTMKAFGIEANNAIGIVNRFNEVGKLVAPR